MASSIGLYPNSYYILHPHKISKLNKNLKFFFSALPTFSKSSSIRGKTSTFTSSAVQNDVAVLPAEPRCSSSFTEQTEFPLSGLENVVTGYILGKNKATEIAHALWKNVVRKGDAVVNATCGNGYDTLAMLRLIADETRKGRVYGMDVQKDALESTASLLDQSISPDERGLVELYALCHAKMEEIVPRGVAVKLVAFNLGYLPGGDKKIKTESETTLPALEAAKNILARGGLISVVVYLGHSGGREEFETVESFASGLPFEKWSCCKLQMLNRPLAPVLVLLSKK